MVYADVDGNIGYQSPGRIPIAGKGDGNWPAPGWDPAYEWRGYLPFEELPHVLNPSQGYIVTANQAVIGPQLPALADRRLVVRLPLPAHQRADLRAARKLSVADVQRMQFDNRNGFAPTLVPHLLAAALAARRSRKRPGAAAGLGLPAARRGGRTPRRGRPPPPRTTTPSGGTCWRASSTSCPTTGCPTAATAGSRWSGALLAEPSSRGGTTGHAGRRVRADTSCRPRMRDAAGELSDRLGDDPAGGAGATCTPLDAA